MQTDDQQPEHSPEPQRTGGRPDSVGLAANSRTLDPEEHGEEAHHLEVEDAR